MTIYQYNLKCMACGLHFQIYSWKPNWLALHIPFCPECSAQNVLPLAVIKHDDKHIYEFVSGVSSDIHPNQLELDLRLENRDQV